MDLTILETVFTKALKQSKELANLSITIPEGSLTITIEPVKDSKVEFSCEAMFHIVGGNIVFVEGTITQKRKKIKVTIAKINVSSGTRNVNETFCFDKNDLN